VEAHVAALAVQLEDLRELVEAWILDRNLVGNAAQERFVDQRRGIEVRREGNQDVDMSYSANRVFHSLSVTLIGDDASSTVCAFYVKLDRNAQFPSVRDPGSTRKLSWLDDFCYPLPLGTQSAAPAAAHLFNSAA
jgi:hypothetical protein